MSMHDGYGQSPQPWLRRHQGPLIAAVIVAASVAAVSVYRLSSQTATTGTTGRTVTYVVSGDAADVTYGPAGTGLQGSVPMRVGDQLGTATYYAIDAQLQGDGTVSCQILVDGTAVSSASASGGYNLARCEIIRDLSGNWIDANSVG